MAERERRGDFIEQLRRLDEALAGQEPSAELDRRMQAALAGEPRQPARAVRPGFLVVAAGALAVLLLALFIIRPAPPPTPHHPLPAAGFQVSGGTTTLGRQDRSLGCASPRCTVTLGAAKVRLLLAEGTRIRRRGDHVELLQGTATCEVKPRSQGAVKVFVSHGVIEVTGTMFHLRQRPNGGSVTLHRGGIRFRSTAGAGRVVTLRPGQTLAWPLSARAGSEGDAGPVPNADAAGRTRPDAGPVRPGPGQRQGPPLSPAAEAALRHDVERMRSQGRYAAAAAAIRRALPRLQGRTKRALYSYELGLILTHHLADPRRGCRHWRRHLARFGATRHGAEIAAARQKLGCP